MRTTSSASASTSSGSVSRTRTPVSSATWSLRLSRCWTLTVEKTSISAASTSATSSKRFGCSTPGAFVCASSSIRQSSGERFRIAGRSISSSAGAAVGNRAPRHHLEAIDQRRGLGAAMGFDHARPPHRVPPPRPRGPPGASGRSSRPRRPCRGRSCGDRPSSSGAYAGEAERQAPSRLWTIRSISLIPTNGATGRRSRRSAGCGAGARSPPPPGSGPRAGPAARAAG